METIPFELLVNQLTMAAGLALVVERFTEVLKHIKERANRAFLEREAERNALLRVDQSKADAEKILNHFRSGESAVSAVLGSLTKNEPAAEDTPDTFEQFRSLPCQKIPKVEPWQASLDLFVRLAPIALGIVLASLFDLHLVSLFTNDVATTPQASAEAGLSGDYFRHLSDILLSGILIGGGSQPVHLLLRFLTTRRLTQEEQAAQATEVDVAEEANEPEKTPKQTVIESAGSRYAWQNIVYQGGVKPQSLENRNRRSHDPEGIVVHHTAMNSKLDFNAIVDEFLVQKKWSTGYHCVIMPDGAIRPFCRWDRIGNHCKGHNSKTLGVSFHGNFHHLPGDAYSNHDGRYGNKIPTDAQIQSGARLIALWKYLYRDSLVDSKVIKPHRDMSGANTVCPGSAFPLAQVMAEVRAFELSWRESSSAQQQLTQFAQKPYLYVAGGPNGRL